MFSSAVARHRLAFSALALGLALAHAPARAIEGEGWLLEGYGSLAINRSNDPVATVRAEPRSASGTQAGEHQWDGDSLAAVQLTLAPQSPVRVVWQLLAKDDLDGRYRPRTEWLYLSWDTSAAWNLKLGRIVQPVFMLSDVRNVAYAQTDARPQTVLYSLNPITHMDGASISWNGRVAGNSVGVDLALGQTRVRLAQGELDFSSIGGLALRWSRGPLSLRLGLSSYHADLNAPAVSAALSALASGLTACGNCAQVLAERVRQQGFAAHLGTLGFSWDDGIWVLQGEYARRRSNSTIASNAFAAYALLGHRFGALTPYLLLGKVQDQEPPLNLTTLPGAPASAAAANAAFEGFLRGQAGRRSRGLGLRWDLREGLAAKLQWEQLDKQRDPIFGSGAVLSIPAPPPVGNYRGPAFDGRAELLTLKLDWVF